VPEYRIYTVSDRNKIAEPLEIATCGSDEEAIGQAKQLLDGRELEVWQGARQVIRLRPSHT
jgi:hypothetical protein